MDSDQSVALPHRFGGSTLLTMQCARPRPGRPFGADAVAKLTADGLLGQVLWSTTCTAYDVAPANFQQLRDSGLFLARVDLSGVAGDATRVRELVLAVQVLRSLGILVEYDLDLFTGTPRFAGVRDKVAMLRAMVGDGSTPAYFTTAAIEADCSPWLAGYRQRLDPAVRPWLGDGGLSQQLADAWAEILLAERLLLGLRGGAAHRIALQRLTLRSNTELLNLVATSAREFETSGGTRLLDDELVGPRAELLTQTMLALRNRFWSANDHVVPEPSAAYGG
ncbi:hypothetical protein [Kribbella sp. NPDC051770]|uniref:hypothetical protein n=1 Tax=Kribbella sp. NPDC051770 TaxID=3155413 RepID=UPI0034312E1C